MNEQARGAIGAMAGLCKTSQVDGKATTHDELQMIESELRAISLRAYEFACRAGVAYPAEANKCSQPTAENLIATVCRISEVVGDVRKSIEAIESIA